MKINEWENIACTMRPKVRYWVPGAAMDEEDLKEELRLMWERGFGGVEIVPLLETPREIIHSEDGWDTENWKRMLRVIADTTKELGMSFDVANGPMWPISMPSVTSADHPAALRELTYGMVEWEGGLYDGPLPKRRKIHKEGTPELVHVLAYQKNPEGQLVEGTYQNLTEFQENGWLCAELPEAAGTNSWVIFAFYEQPAVQKTADNMYYVIDHLGKAGADACREYWEPLLEKEEYPSMESIFCDSLEYQTVMDWTRNFVEEFEQSRGYSVLPYLPFLGQEGVYPPHDLTGFQLDEPGLSEMIRRDYCEVLTQCYCKNHLKILEDMARRYGKSIRYQVAYNKAFEIERCGLYVGIPENEALGRPALDCLKAMAAAAHLGRKERYSFECAAIFGNAYGQDYEDLFWWVKRSLMAGMNAQVLHGASYSGAYHGRLSQEGAMPGVQWPGYEAFSVVVSNNWNRTPSLEDARGCMDAIARMNALFRKQAKVDCVIYREAYLNPGTFSDHGMYPDKGALGRSGYSYEWISPELMELLVCTVKDGLLDSEGPAYQCLVIPEISYVSIRGLEKMLEFARNGLVTVWVGRKPQYTAFYGEWIEPKKREQWRSLRDALWERCIHVAEYEEVPGALMQAGIMPRLMLDSSINMATALREDRNQKRSYYMLYAYNSVEFTPDTPNPKELVCSAMFREGTTKSTYRRPGKASCTEIRVWLRGLGRVWKCNPWNGQVKPLDFKPSEDGKHMMGTLQMEEDDFVILALDPEEREMEPADKSMVESCVVPVKMDRLLLRAFGPNREGEKSFLRSGFSKETKEVTLDKLVPWQQLPEAGEQFIGQGIYEGHVIVGHVDRLVEACFCAGNVCDSFHVLVNGEPAAFPDQVRKEADILANLKEGDNIIRVVVTSNLYNCCIQKAGESRMPFQVPVSMKDYGMWETLDRHCELQLKYRYH